MSEGAGGTSSDPGGVHGRVLPVGRGVADLADPPGFAIAPRRRLRQAGHPPPAAGLPARGDARLPPGVRRDADQPARRAVDLALAVPDDLPRLPEGHGGHHPGARRRPGAGRSGASSPAPGLPALRVHAGARARRRPHRRPARGARSGSRPTLRAAIGVVPASWRWHSWSSRPAWSSTSSAGATSCRWSSCFRPPRRSGSRRSSARDRLGVGRRLPAPVLEPAGLRLAGPASSASGTGSSSGRSVAVRSAISLSSRRRPSSSVIGSRPSSRNCRLST